MKAQAAVFKIFYNQKDITTDVSEFLISVRYLDRMYNEVDELEIKLEDSENYWKNNWYPRKGDTLKLQMGYDDLLVDCGTFEIDEIAASGPPDTVTLRSLATWVTSAMRTVKNRVSDGLTIKQIAEKIAGEQGLTLKGEIFTVRVAKSTQFEETDLEYLNRLGNEYGFVFKVRGTQLVFTSIYDQEDYNKYRPVYDIDLTDCMAWSFRDKTSGIFNKVVSSYYDPQTGTTIAKELRANQDFIDFNNIKDVAKIYSRTEDASQAELKSRAQLHKYNTKQQEGSVTVPGYPLLVGGNNVNLTGFGELSGVYHIISSEHLDDRSGGYTTTIEIKRIGFVDKARKKPKKQSLKTQAYKVVNENSVGQ